jgi:uncharacterized protein YfaP (DUF2135 family)
MKAVRMRSRVLLAIVVAFTAGCGGPTAPAPYSQTISGTVSVFGSTYHPFTIPRSGQMSLSLTWSDPTIDLDLYLASPNCTQAIGLHPLANCGIILASNSAVGVVREAIARSVNSGESYSIWVDNLSATKAATYTLDLTIQ